MRFESHRWLVSFLALFGPLATLAILLAVTHPLQISVPRKENTNPSERVNEAMFVRIGGIDQWITIKGRDRGNPVLLFLHGGPGDAWSPVADAMFRGWDDYFTLVQWDQRGAGRTYGKTGPSIEPTMTMDRMVKDGIEVSEFLKAHLKQKKIIITGASWGSILGVHLAQARPDLFFAYVGAAQIVNERQDLAASFARVLELARDAGDQEAVAALTEIGSPPWDSLRKWPVYRKWELKYQAKLATAAPVPDFTSPEYDSPGERARWHAADDFSFLHFGKMDLSGELMQVDLPALGTDFSIPIFMFQGEEDLTAIPELAKSYFDRIRAPQKEFYLGPAPGMSHQPTSLSWS